MASLRSSLTRWVPVAILLALGGTLSATLLSSYRIVGTVARTLARGQGEMLLHDVTRATRGGAWTDAATLRRVVDSLAAGGLRCLVILDSDLGLIAQSGRCAPLGAPETLQLPPGEVVPVGDTLRMLRTPPPPIMPLGELGPGPGRRPPGAPPLPRPVLIEFVPQQAGLLRSSAARTLLAGGLATFALLVAGVVYVRLSLRAARLEAARERDRSLASLGEMSAVLAHELRNPLAALKGHTQLLIEALPEGSKQRDKAQRIVREALRIERLSQDLLALARPGALSIYSVDPAALLRDSAQALIAEGGTVEVHAEGAPRQWRLDPLRIHQVLGNLLRNAREAAPGQPVSVSVGVRDGVLVFVVRDRGPGVPPEERERVFEPFFTTRARGTGLGLAISRRLIEMHGGSISVRGADGGGAEFEVRVPAPEGAAAAIIAAERRS